MKRSLSAFFILILQTLSVAFAQTATPASDAKVNHPGSDVANNYALTPYLTTHEFVLSLLVLLFGLGVLIFQFALLRKIKASASDSMKTFTVTLIVVGVLFTITAGYSSQAVAPAMGLFGTIAGYLLGRRDTTAEHNPEAE